MRSSTGKAIGLNSLTDKRSWRGRPNGRLQVGDEYVDTVCHAEVPVGPQTPFVSWRGDSFSFCSHFCRERFLRNPDAFLVAIHKSLESDRIGEDHAAA